MADEIGHQAQASRQVSGSQHVTREGTNSICTATPSAVSSLKDIPHSGPCRIQYCSKDTIVDCAGLSLTEVSSSWFPRNTTAIFLDNNALKLINNSSFSHLSDLRVLDLSSNRIKHIQPNAFRGLGRLETLNLEHNYLSQAAYPPDLFISLVRLKDLRLCCNKVNSNLPDHLFKDLKNILTLTLDTAGDTLSLGKEFSNLSTLVLSGDLKTLDENSFENVQNTTNLFAQDLISLSNFTDTSLQPLHHLNVFSLTDTQIGVTKALHTLKPLIGKEMTTIYFNRVSLSGNEGYTSLHHNEGILNLEKTQYLIQICVRDFSLRNSRIFVVEANAFTSPLWKKCLRSLDLSNNPLGGTKLAFLFIINLKHIEIINLENVFRDCYDTVSFSNGGTLVTEPGISPVRQQLSTCDNDYFSDKGTLVTEPGICPVRKQLSTCDNDVLSSDSQASKYGNNETKRKIEQLLPQDYNTNSHITFVEAASEESKSLTLKHTRPFRCSYNDMSLNGGHYSSYFTLYFSDSLKHLDFSRLISGVRLNANVVLAGLNNLISLDLRDNILKDYTGNLIGLDSLQTLMMSGNDVSLLAGHFFDGMCNLVELDLSNCRLDPVFMSKQSDRVFQNLLQLKRLDLSSNTLYSLKPGTFVPNKMLEQLDLSKNRFKNIPFNLKDTPNLKMLDLRENSLPSLESNERDELDKLANQHGEFNLFISGNVLSCGCDSLRFLHWLATTRVRLDDERNFTCINNEGHLSYWSVSDDLEVLWRKCSGETFLALAIILFFNMAIGFLSVSFIWKNKTFIQSVLLQLLKGYKLKSREDYKNGVFIGYADKDYIFPCLVLRKFIEDKLKLSTYVSDIDMDPRGGVASCIWNAINNSWRTVLVFSENFMENDQWSIVTYRFAVHAISPANPARVVVLVHENLQHRLPAEVVSAVPEENIIVVSQWAMNYDLCEKLRTRLT